MLVSKSLHPQDYEELKQSVHDIHFGVARSLGALIQVYISHPHRYWEYASVLEAARALPDDFTAIDFGGGYGPLAVTLALTRGAHVREVELDARLDFRKEIGAMLHLEGRHQWEVGDLTTYQGEPTDLVTCVSVVEHVPPEQMDQAWSNLLAHVKLGGVLAVTLDYNDDNEREWSQDSERVTKYGPREIESVLGKLRANDFHFYCDPIYHGPQVNDYTFFRIIAQRSK